MIHDSHCHFFSSRFLEVLGAEKYGAAGSTADAMATELGWDAPGPPSALADRWIAELDRQEVSRAALIASVPGDEDSVAAAVARHPQRFVGMFMLNAASPDAVERSARAFGDLGLRVACLFPALHRYRLDDACVARVFETAAAHGGAVFAHCGYLSVGARVKLGLPNRFDLRLGDPLALATTAAQFPNVPVLIPHFGAGFFREALMAAEACASIHFDTSSSNRWIRYMPGLTLTDVFQLALAVVGPNRLLFGTDSSFFPRGWQRAIYDAQRTVLGELGVAGADAEQIFARNFARLFPAPLVDARRASAAG